MPSAQLHILTPELLADFVQADPLRAALSDIAQLADAELKVSSFELPVSGSASESQYGPESFSVRRNGLEAGRVEVVSSSKLETGNSKLPSAVGGLLEHLLDREAAVVDLVEAMMTSYEELNVLYRLLPTIATSINDRQVGDVLVEQAAQTLHCDRVSLLVFDESRKNLRVLASRGLPTEIGEITIPIVGTIAEYAMLEEDLLIVNDAMDRPELAARSRGTYESAAYAVARVPLRAQGQAVGFLSATERRGSPDFTARDRKLLEGFSAMGASALLNCHLHAAVNRQMMSTIEALACAVDAKDQYTHDHSGRVSRLCVATAKALGVKDDATCREIELSGLLHDIGKIGVPDSILSKPERLDSREYEIVKTHVSIGAGIVEKVQGLERVAKAILHHHERYDGLGYPSGLIGDQIPLASKLIAVSDTYDSLTSDRSYRKATSKENGLRELNRWKGMQFDPAIVQAFATVVQNEN